VDLAIGAGNSGCRAALPRGDRLLAGPAPLVPRSASTGRDHPGGDPDMPTPMPVAHAGGRPR
jgi:hypothetical protein